MFCKHLFWSAKTCSGRPGCLHPPPPCRCGAHAEVSEATTAAAKIRPRHKQKLPRCRAWPAAGRSRGTLPGSQDTGAGVARVWRGRIAGCRQSLAWVARAWCGRGTGLSCDPFAGRGSGLWGEAQAQTRRPNLCPPSNVFVLPENYMASENTPKMNPDLAAVSQT
eukprot:gene9510-biopygen7691